MNWYRRQRGQTYWNCIYSSITDGEEDRHIHTNSVFSYCTPNKELIQKERRAQILELVTFSFYMNKEFVQEERRTNRLEL